MKKDTRHKGRRQKAEVFFKLKASLLGLLPEPKYYGIKSPEIII